jgi:S1-C subfamily serine protease
MRDDSGYGFRESGGRPGTAGPGPGNGRGDGPPPPPRRSRRGTAVATHLAAALLAAGAAVGITLGVYHPAASPAASALPGSSAVPSPAAGPASGAPAAGGGEQQAVNKVEPGLVVINTTQQYSSQAAAGTGMVINPAGLVLTNNHVIEDATKITATVIATGKTYPAAVIGYDKTADIALIRLQGASGLRTVPLGNSAAVKAGTPVVALGNAEGQGTIIPAAGQVTGTGKTITAADQGGTASTETLHGMIQVNAGIVPGDSGGPLATTGGQVIGMDTAGNTVSLTQQTTAGFAIPIDTALGVARQIAAGQASSAVTIGYPPFLGIFTGSGTDPSPQDQAQQQALQNGFGDGFGGFGGFNGFGSPATTPACYTSNTGLAVPSAIAPASSGTLVDGTICGSPAATAGITAGSVITAINGRPAGAPAGLSATLARYRPGDTISLTWVSPAGQRTTSSIRLAAGPPQLPGPGIHPGRARRPAGITHPDPSSATR